MHIPTLAPDVLFTIGSVPITNTIINTWLAIIIFLVVGLVIKKSASLRPAKLQNFLEWIMESLFEYFDQVTGDRKKTIKFLPLVGSVFFFILLSNFCIDHFKKVLIFTRQAPNLFRLRCSKCLLRPTSREACQILFLR